jgi:hypothetical protein
MSKNMEFKENDFEDISFIVSKWRMNTASYFNPWI